MSQLSLALAIGYKNNSDVSRIEKGTQWPDFDKLTSIAKHLDCAIWELFAEAEGVGPAGEVPRQPKRREPPPLLATEPPARTYLQRGDPPSLDDALKDVAFYLREGEGQELLASIAFQGMMTRHAAERICSALNGVAMAVESLRDAVEGGKSG